MEPHRQNTSNIYQHLVFFTKCIWILDPLQNQNPAQKIGAATKLEPSRKMQGHCQHHFTTKSRAHCQHASESPKMAVPKKTVYTGGRRLVRGLCMCDNVHNMHQITMFISTLTYSSISSLQLTKRRFASARADRRHTAAIRPIESGRFVSRFEALTPCLPQSRKVEEEAQWKPMGVLWMLHPFCQPVNKGHTSSDGVHVCQCVSPLSRSSGSVSTVTESISIKHLLQSIYTRLSLLNVPVNATIIMDTGVTGHEYSSDHSYGYSFTYRHFYSAPARVRPGQLHSNWQKASPEPSRRVSG